MQKVYILIDTETKKKYEFDTKKELFEFLYQSSVLNFEIKEDWYGVSI
jgi:hypothetical protein